MDKDHFEEYQWMEKTVKEIEEKLPAMEKAHLDENDLDKSMALEKAFDEEETRIMKEIIEHRHCLWT